MKKVLIGCGIVVLLVLVGLGYVGKQIWPNVQRAQSEWQAAFDELQALDREHPFDAAQQLQLDAARFEQMLDVRIALAEDFKRFNAEMEAIGEAHEQDEGPGLIDTFKRYIDHVAPLLSDFAARLREVAMGPDEFAWHTRLLWGALARVDNGLGGPGTEVLRDEYSHFEKRYDTLRRDQEGLLPLRDLTAKLPLEALVTAGQVLAKDPARVKRAVAFTDFDHVYMQPLESLEDVERTEAPPPAETPAPEPAAAPTTAPTTPPPTAPEPAEPAPR
jgi:hypothetical protein